jgi:hypothetical protein
MSSERLLSISQRELPTISLSRLESKLDRLWRRFKHAERIYDNQLEFGNEDEFSESDCEADCEADRGSDLDEADEDDEGLVGPGWDGRLREQILRIDRLHACYERLVSYCQAFRQTAKLVERLKPFGGESGDDDDNVELLHLPAPQRRLKPLAQTPPRTLKPRI